MKDFMVVKREEKNLTRGEMAKRCGCSEYLIELLEEGDREITHPKIAAWIAKEYGLTVDEYNQLVHRSHKTQKLPKARPWAIYSGFDKAFQARWADGSEGD